MYRQLGPAVNGVSFNADCAASMQTRASRRSPVGDAMRARKGARSSVQPALRGRRGQRSAIRELARFIESDIKQSKRDLRTGDLDDTVRMPGSADTEHRTG